MILGIIGIVFFGLMSIIGILLISLQNNLSYRHAIESSAASNPSANTTNINDMLANIAQSGWLIFIGSSIAFLLGFIAAVYIKGNKKPKTSGILFLVSAAIALILTKGGDFLPDILYIIAGIMALMRKPKKTQNESY